LVSSGLSGIGFGDTTNTLAAGGSAVGIPATRTLGFYTSSGSALVERARIDSTGKLGLNVTAPAHTLEVQGTFNATVPSGSARLASTGDFVIGI
jgi:hypothetical protein